MIADLSQIAAAQKDALLEREQKALAELAVAFGAVYEKIKGAAARINEEIAQLFKGEPPPPEYLNERDRLQNLRIEIERALREFSTSATRKISSAQAAALEYGTTDAELLLGASDLRAGARVAAVSNQLALLVGKSADGSALSLLFEKMAPTVARAVAEELLLGVSEGAAVRVIAERIRERSGMALTRSLLIARQETLRVYREAALETYRSTTGVLSWRWLAALDPRTCALCWAMDGRIFPLSVKFTSHVGCRCSMVPITSESAKARTGAEVFAEQEPGVQLQVLGPIKFKLFEEGKLTLDQVVGVRHSPQWGLVRYERSASEILRA